MIADYASDSSLYEQCLTLLDSCFPGVKVMADKGRSHNAYWDKSSVPFIERKGDELIAHVGLLPFYFIIQGVSYHAAAIHGICTKDAYRKQGYFKKLMHEALATVQQKYDFSFLFTDQPYLYEQFGFRVLPEYDFEYTYSAKGNKAKLRKIDLDNPDDLHLFQSMLLNRIPISNCFGIIKESTVATLNAFHMSVFYIEEVNALIVYDVISDVLYLKDIITLSPCDLSQVLSAIPEKFSKVILQFPPDGFLYQPYHAITASPECSFMVSSDFDMKCSIFRYPELQRC